MYGRLVSTLTRRHRRRRSCKQRRSYLGVSLLSILDVSWEHVPKSERRRNSEQGKVLKAVVCRLVSVVLNAPVAADTKDILMPNRPVRTRAANSRTKPTVNCWSLEMVGAKGWLAEASQRLWRGVEDMDVLSCCSVVVECLKSSSWSTTSSSTKGQIELLLPLNSWSSARLLGAHAGVPQSATFTCQLADSATTTPSAHNRCLDMN